MRALGLLLGAAAAGAALALAAWHGAGLAGCEGKACRSALLPTLGLVAAAGVAWGFALRRAAELWAPAASGAVAVAVGGGLAHASGSDLPDLVVQAGGAVVLPVAAMGILTLAAAVALAVRRARSRLPPG